MARPRKYNKILIENNETSYVYCIHGALIVDTIMLPLIRSYTWFTKKSRAGTYYAYASVTINKKETKVMLHRVLIGATEGQFVDHINGNTLDNRMCNLRFCSSLQNNFNAKKRINSKSIYKGVSLSKEGAFKASIQANKIKYHLGTFKTEIEAAKAYDKKAKELHKQFARLNFPKE